MSIRFLATLVAFGAALIGTSCGSGTPGEMIPAPTSLARTLTQPVGLTPAPSETPLSPTSLPTVVPVDGITSTQVNVRAEPSTASQVLGTIPADMRVEITGKDPAGNWWQINYEQAADGKGWVAAQYVTMPTAVEVPIIGGAETDATKGNIAIVEQQINVRSGPGTDFNSLGTLNPQDVVSLTGKDAGGAWLQIDFASGPEGRGWVNAAFVQAQGAETLPIVAESGQVVGTGTPSAIPPTPTPTLVPAWEDHDTQENPIARVVFEPAGTQTLIYSGDLSAPLGDPEDWIAFRPYLRSVFASLECKGSAAVEVEILENGLPVSTYMKCGAIMEELPVNPGSDFVLHLKAVAAAGPLQYTNYILTIKTRP